MMLFANERESDKRKFVLHVRVVLKNNDELAIKFHKINLNRAMRKNDHKIEITDFVIRLL